VWGISLELRRCDYLGGPLLLVHPQLVCYHL
jgi:hypothetical protein